MANLKATPLRLGGLVLLEPRLFGDDRGYFLETYNQRVWSEAGITCEFVQDSQSRSAARTLRGLHYQTEPGQAKLVRVLSGTIFDVAVDIRPDSPTFGQWEGVELAADDHQQLFLPVGFAHGFCVLSDEATIAYKLSALYDPNTEAELRWNDPDIGVDWPVPDPLLSPRDQNAESFAALRARLGRA